MKFLKSRLSDLNQSPARYEGAALPDELSRQNALFLQANWAILDLNQGPKDYESSALTAELMAQVE